MSFWYQQDQDHWLENKLATLLLLQIVASPDTNASHSSSVDKDGSFRWNVHSKWIVQTSYDVTFILKVGSSLG